MKLPGRDTAYGFEWGVTKVTRLFEHEGRIAMEVKTPRQSIRIDVTPTDLILVYKDGKRMKIP